MASKTTNYLLGFLSGTITGITLGILAFWSKNPKREKKEPNKDED